jgi:hypothetical protein
MVPIFDITGFPLANTIPLIAVKILIFCCGEARKLLYPKKSPSSVPAS